MTSSSVALRGAASVRVLVILCSALLVLLSLGRGGAAPSGAQPISFQEPLALRSVGGVLDATMVLDEGPADIGGSTVNGVWTYHIEGEWNYPGPTLYVNPGDTLRVRYMNQLDSQSTNLHTHGLHVTPLGNSDNVMLIIPPGAENQYEVDIPEDHPQGLYWYHPHRHGTVNPQVYMGLSGLLVIGRPDGGAPQLSKARQRLLGMTYAYVDPATNSLKDAPFNVVNGQAFFSDTANLRFTVNGQLNPTINIRPGEREVWNVGNISNNGFFSLRLRGTGGSPDQPLVLVAQDGQPFTQAVRLPANQGLLFAPGVRHSLVVDGPPAGTYELVMDAHDDGFFQWPASRSNGSYQQGRPLATLVSAGPAVQPAPAIDRLTPPANQFEPLNQASVDYRRTANFSANFNVSPPQFLINNGAFPNNPVFQPRLKTVEEWELVNLTGEQHPFHIHVNDFQLQSLFDPSTAANNVSRPQSWFQDIVTLEPAFSPVDGSPITPSRLRLRMRATTFLGSYVYHCHRVDHEDLGMMALVTIIPEIPIYAVNQAKGKKPTVEVFSGLDNKRIARFNAFPNQFGGEVRLAVGDVDRDGVLDVIAASGPGAPARVRVFSGKTRFRKTLMDFEPFQGRLAGGLNVAVADMNSDSYDDIVVAPGQGGDPEVRVFSGRGGALIASFMAYERQFQGGVQLAAGIMRDGGRNSIVTAPGPGRAPMLKLFEVDWYGDHGSHVHSPRSAAARPGRTGKAGVRPHGKKEEDDLMPIMEMASALAFNSSFSGGVNLGAGPVDGLNGGFSVILAGPAGVAGPLVGAFQITGGPNHDAGGEDTPLEITGLASFWPYGPKSMPGVAVGAVSTPTGADVVVAPTAPGHSLKRFRYVPTAQFFEEVGAVPLRGLGASTINIAGR